MAVYPRLPFSVVEVDGDEEAADICRCSLAAGAAACVAAIELTIPAHPHLLASTSIVNAKMIATLTSREQRPATIVQFGGQTGALRLQ